MPVQTSCFLFILLGTSSLAALLEKEMPGRGQIKVEVTADGSLTSSLQVMRRQPESVALAESAHGAPVLKGQEDARAVNRSFQLKSGVALSGRRHRKKLLQNEGNKVSLMAVLVFGLIVTFGLSAAGVMSYLVVAPRVVMKRRPITAGNMYRRSEKDATIDWGH
mmetsp:Transcript_34762/g.64688  ORF Transcript_34762/g.64688 Transcript_34762/m.64688 type:complete len:164 (-) Transcript_34762:36-527(-)